MKPEIIPFGKYKNQPVDVLKQDTQYMEWLVNQDWFRERYPSINTLIVNNFHQPNDTPEHNQLVSLFLNESFQINFSKVILENKLNGFFDQTELKSLFKPKHDWGVESKYESQRYSWKKAIEFAGKIDLSLPVNIISASEAIQMPHVIDDIVKPLTYQSISIDYYPFEFEFEHRKGSDVIFSVAAKETVRIINSYNNLFFDYSHRLSKDHEQVNYGGLNNRHDFSIEVKPILSDDYPSIIRQCRDQLSNVLFFDQFTATGATLDQVRKMFTDIYFVQKSDVEKLM